MKIIKSYSLLAGALMAVAIILTGCGKKGGDSPPGGVPDETSIQLSGVAASGAPIASAIITLKDQNGTLKTGTTGTDGKYSIDITGLNAPFLLKVASAGANIYSVATSSGTANLHPFTDLIVRNWYKVHETDVDAAFGSTGPLLSPPTAADVATVETVVRNLLNAWLQQEGLDASSFNLITSSFDADSAGFDAILDNTRVAIDAAGQVTVDSTDPATGIEATAISTNIVNLSAADTTPPGAPSGVLATGADKNKIVLVWNASTDNVGVAGYTVYRGNAKLGQSPNPVYTDSSGLASDTQYCYQVEAFDGAGNVSTRSSQSCARTLAASDSTLPTTPTGLTATATSTAEIGLSWTPSTDDNLVGYKIFRDGKKVGAVSTTSCVDKGLSAGTQYCYTVYAFDAAGNLSPASSRICTTTLTAAASGSSGPPQ